MRIAIAVHDPLWTLPATEAQRLAALLSSDDVVYVRSDSERRRSFERAEIIFGHRLSTDEFRAAPHLKWLHSPSVSVSGLLNDEVVGSGVIVTNSKGVHAAAIAEHAIALTLALRRHLPAAVRHQVAHEWAQEEILAASTSFDKPLDAGTMLVAGLGAIGSRVAKAAAALGMAVWGLRRDPDKPQPAEVDRLLSRHEMLEALPLVDVFVLALPATRETWHMVGRREFAAMKPSAVLINVGRGDLVDEVELVRVLSAGRLAGAGLDTFEREPLPFDHPLWDLPNVLVTPHVAPFGGKFWPPLVDLFVANVKRYKDAAPLENIVDKSAGY
jgi:phosphoglycerate dehydrogenase-like enzyme